MKAHRVRIDLSHTIRDGLLTYKGLPAPHICDFLSREEARTIYKEGVSFQIGRIDMVANTGTYIDTPFHRYAEGADLAAMKLEQLCALPGICLDARGQHTINGAWLEAQEKDVLGAAVLIHTSWDMHWNTPHYYNGQHPFLDRSAAVWLQEAGAALVGIDSYNIDDITDMARPVHSVLLGAQIPIVEHMTSLGQLPTSGFAFYAVPPKIEGLGSFPVRAFAEI